MTYDMQEAHYRIPEDTEDVGLQIARLVSAFQRAHSLGAATPNGEGVFESNAILAHQDAEALVQTLSETNGHLDRIADALEKLAGGQ
jgi:hypothetical protein